MWDRLDPNDPLEIAKMLVGIEIENLWKLAMKTCKEIIRKCTSKTGGSPGDPENHSDFECQDL